MLTKHLDSKEIRLAAAYRHGGISPIWDTTKGKKFPEVELQQLDAHALGCSACNRLVVEQLAQFTRSLKDLAAGQFPPWQVGRLTP